MDRRGGLLFDASPLTPRPLVAQADWFRSKATRLLRYPQSFNTPLESLVSSNRINAEDAPVLRCSVGRGSMSRTGNACRLFGRRATHTTPHREHV